MSKFSDILNKPLPSKLTTISESAEDELNNQGDNGDVEDAATPANGEGETTDEGCNPCTKEGCNPCTNEGCNPCTKEGCNPYTKCEDVGTDDIEDASDDEDNFDPDDLSDEELAAIDKELGDDALNSVVDDEDDEVTLTPDEEMEADDMMNMAATTLLVNDELNAEEKAEFLETQAGVAIEEGFMTEADVNAMCTELGLAQENSYNKKMIIRLDAASKKKQLYALAVNVSAAAHGDPDYIKLKKVMKMRKILRAKLERKYKAEATKRMKIYYNRLSHSKSGTLSKLAKKAADK